MILAIDIGNTNIVLGGLEGEEITFEARMATDHIKTSDQYCIDLKAMLSLFEVNPTSLEGAIVSSVVPPVMQSVSKALERLTGRRPMIVGPGLKTGLRIAIDNPAQAGSDLVVAAVAVLEEYGAPACIIDMGTATTISALDRDGRFCGGTIYPGVRLSLNALTTGTAQLPAISLEAPRHPIGTNTVDSMRSGMLFGTACMLDGMVKRFEEELGYPTKVLATGGLAPLVAPLCRHKIILDDKLLLKGLRSIYRRNAR